ncbi:hypothetical protein Tco_1033280, partial [Tanacetum coccineum]
AEGYHVTAAQLEEGQSLGGRYSPRDGPSDPRISWIWVVVDPEATLLIQGVVILVTHLRETVGAGHTLRIIVVVDPEATCLIQGFVLLVTHLREARVGAGHTLRIIVAILSRVNTGVKPEILKNVRKAIATLPETFKPHKAVKKSDKSVCLKKQHVVHSNRLGTESATAFLTFRLDTSHVRRMNESKNPLCAFPARLSLRVSGDSCFMPSSGSINSKRSLGNALVNMSAS